MPGNPTGFRRCRKSDFQTILLSILFKKCEYKIEISEIDGDSRGSKSFKIKVTDPTLIAISGGIVRGMSGSPIIQNGKLIGAVTHVLLDDPTTGYGIFAENMLETAQSVAEEKLEEAS